jgi:hypothetical protein
MLSKFRFYYRQDQEAAQALLRRAFQCLPDHKRTLEPSLALKAFMISTHDIVWWCNDKPDQK